MEHVIRAEYEEGSSPRDAEPQVVLWHVVRGERGTTAMCGHEIVPGAAAQSSDAWSTDAAQPFCSLCGALYLREVP